MPENLAGAAKYHLGEELKSTSLNRVYLGIIEPGSLLDNESAFTTSCIPRDAKNMGVNSGAHGEHDSGNTEILLM